MFRGTNFESFMANMKEQEARMMQWALGVDERQWKVIEPKLEKVRTYRDQAIGGIGTSSFGGSFINFPMMTDPNQTRGGFHAPPMTFGGFGSFSSTSDMLNRQPTEVETIAGELQVLVQNHHQNLNQ